MCAPAGVSACPVGTSITPLGCTPTTMKCRTAKPAAVADAKSENHSTIRGENLGRICSSVKPGTTYPPGAME